jgi:hypothetical protein
MDMSTLAVIAIIVLVSVPASRLIARFVPRWRRVPLMSMSRARSANPPASSADGVATPRAPAAVSALEPVARAFLVHGLPPSRTAAVALERILRSVVGVTAVYVSHVTALVYLDYLPAQVTEDEIVEAMQCEGYRVGDASHRFDWRHAQQGESGP